MNQHKNFLMAFSCSFGWIVVKKENTKLKLSFKHVLQYAKQFGRIRCRIFLGKWDIKYMLIRKRKLL